MAVNSDAFVDRCPSCGTTLKIDPSVAGEYSRCPSCGAMLRVVAPGSRARKKKRPATNEESLGVLAFWICGIGAALTVFSIAGVVAVGMRNKAATTTPPPVGVAAPGGKPTLARTSDANDWSSDSPPVSVSPPSLPAKDRVAARDKTPSSPDRSDDQPEVERERSAPPPRRPSPPPSDSSSGNNREFIKANVVVKIAGIRADVFLTRDAAGRVPALGQAAPFDSHYIFMSLNVRNSSPDRTKVFLDPRAANEAVMLKDGSGNIAQCIGRFRPELAPPRQLDMQPIVMAGHELMSDLTLVFVVPSTWRSAAIVGPGFESGRMPLPEPDVEPASLRELTGWWVRSPNQPLRLQYENPIMALLTRPGVKRMLITREERPGRSIMSIPFVEVAGALTWPEKTGQSLEGSFDLRKGSARLYGRVRVADRRNVLILYASNDPLEQIIYVTQPH